MCFQPAFHGVHNAQLHHSNVNVAHRDIHIHYHNLKDDIEAILDAVTNYRRIQQDTLAKATPGTIQWFFKWKEFEVFIDVNGNLRILWGSGMRKFFLYSFVMLELISFIAGAGKTIFAYVYGILKPLTRSLNIY